MGLLFLIVAGSVLGWLATIIAQAKTLNDTPLNMATGIAGALLAGLVVAPLLGVGSMIGGHYTPGAIMLSLIGAIIAVGSVNIMRQSGAE